MPSSYDSIINEDHNELGCRHCCASSSSSSSFTHNSPKSSYPPSLPLEPKHMRIVLTIDIENRAVEGYNEITVVSNTNNAKKLVLDAVDLEDITVQVSAKGREEEPKQECDFSYTDSKSLIIHLPEPFIPTKKGEERIITVHYAVTNPIGGLYFSYPTDAYPSNPTFAGSDHETERARYWLPCVDHPHVRTTYHWILTSRDEYTILANGKLISQKTHSRSSSYSTDGKWKTVEWKHDYPCPSYLASIAIGKFVSYKDTPTDAGNGKIIPITYYASDDYSSDALRRSFDQTPKMMSWLTKKIGTPMPWAKYDQFALKEFFGAMENQSLVSWDAVYLLDDEDGYEEFKSVVDTINLHEMSHTYFGNMVVMRHFAHAWLKESWAKYLEAVYKEETQPNLDNFHYDLYTNANRYFHEADDEYIRPIVHNTYNSSFDLFDAHLYPGGAWRLHMLRHLIGDDVFWEAVRDYVKVYSGKLVETVDFQRMLEHHSGMLLDAFFEQWIYKAKGYPHLSVTYAFSGEQKEVTFTIKQKQVVPKKGNDDSDDVRSTPFEFDLDLSWLVEGNSEFDVKTVRIDKEEHIFVFRVTKEPTQVRIDPSIKVLFKLDFDPPEKLLSRQLSESPDVIGRIQAAQSLLKSGKAKHFDAVHSHYTNETHWGVRVQICNFLSSSNSRFAIPHLLSILEDETEESKVLFHVVASIGNVRDTRINEALLNLLDRNGVGPRAKAACLLALGKQRAESNFDVLCKYANGDNASGPSTCHYITARGAFDGLGLFRNKKTLKFLLTKVHKGKTGWRTRRNAILAMSSVAKWLGDLEKQIVVEKLTDLARDSSHCVRMAVALGFKILNAKAGIEVIESMKTQHVHQEQVTLERYIASLRSYSKNGQEVNDLKKEIERLNDKVSEMDKRIHRLETKNDKK